MQDYKIVGTIKARELLMSDEKVNRFLTYMGLFTNEINNYLMANDVLVKKNRSLGSLFPHKNANALSTKIAGKRYQIKYGLARGDAVVEKRSYPGMCIYYNSNFFDEFSGYPRIIYEVLDSSVYTNPVNILNKVVEKGNADIHDFSPMQSSTDVWRYAKNFQI